MELAQPVSAEKIGTPFGSLNILVTADLQPVIIGAGFGSLTELTTRVLSQRPGLQIKRQKIPKPIADVFQDWLTGNFLALDALKVDQGGSKFRQDCWRAMRQIKPGKAISYSELAKKTSSPAAVRAAATACAQNLIAPIIPCHRIIKTDGSLGRYGYGESVKRKLLEFEGVDL